MQPAVTGVSNTGLRHGATFSAGPTHSPTLTSKGSSVALGQPTKRRLLHHGWPVYEDPAPVTRRPWRSRGGPASTLRLDDSLI